MADRRVRRTEKTDGDIAALCGGADWPKVRKAQVIQDVESRAHRRYVHEVAPSVDVTAVDGRCGKHLRTVADRTSANNLDNPPNC